MTTETANKKSPAIVFDYGGVLMDWNPHYLFDPMMGNDPKAVDEFLQRVDFFHWNEEFDRGRSYAEGTADLISKYPEYAHLIRAYDEQYLKNRPRMQPGRCGHTQRAEITGIPVVRVEQLVD